MLRIICMSFGLASTIALPVIGFSAEVGEYPYPATDYTEPYRGQFHFTPKAGWMNDVNGIWFYNGVYHMSYQHYPHGTEWNTMHWGHAVSKDMIHWVHKQIMLEPGVVPGDCFSGSVVVDTNNTSGFKTGINPVFVAIYTATGSGTCLAYSNDLGETWQPYSGNPVNVGGPNADTRDPHVFWHADTKKWVCALFESGTTFYTSSDLKHWTKTSVFAFGHECPDIYELPVDGDQKNRKWVLQDASGSYYIGQFDGTQFIADPGGPYKMDVGPNFYAAQTFFRDTFPTSRLVQMQWLTGGTATSPWSQSAGFPCELKLVTSADGVRLTRTPISEIKKIYGEFKTWPKQTFKSGQDLLSTVKGKSYDLTAEFDITDTNASAITFQLANKTIVYDIKNQTLLGKSLIPINNKVKIRVLADWNQLEVFGNDGLFSWTESFVFTPESKLLGLKCDGAVKLISMKFHQIKRIWPSKKMPRVFKSNLNGPWSAVGGYWTVTADGQWGGAKGDAFYLSSHTVDDCIYEGDIKLLSKGAAALLLRADATCSQGYCVNIDSAGVVKLWSPGRGELQTYSTPIKVGTTYHLKVVAIKDNIKVYFNNDASPVIDYTDKNPVYTGRLGLNAFGGSVVFQNVWVSNVTPDATK